MIKKKNLVTLIVAVLIPLVVGGISAALTSNAMSAFGSFKQPPLSPPGWLFPVAWTILYILMGMSSYLLYIDDSTDEDKIRARKLGLITYIAQLVFNFFWSIIFFRAGLYYPAFVWLLIMWALIAFTMLQANKVNKLAMYLLIPYICWSTFAAYLNIGVAILN